jgi:hypothetical protein
MNLGWVLNMDKLPEKIELDFSDIPVFDQGELGSATACATVACLEYMLKHPPKEVEFLYFEIRPI